MSDKIINTFQQRRQLTQAVEALAATRTEAELTAAARAIAHDFPADLVLATLLRHLDTSKSQLRGGLGHLAALLPSDDVTPALRNAMADRQNDPQVRITAALILERFLGQTIPGALISDLEDSNEVAFQSLREAVDEARENRHILLEYVTQMRETDAAVAFMVMDMLARLDPGDRVELLRLIAQDDRDAVAREALQRLAALGTTDARVEAARSLTILGSSLPPALAEQAVREARKLQFAGTHYQPPAPDGWRALLAPSDPGGNQALWLVRNATQPRGLGTILGFMLNARAGILQMFASETIAPEHVPPPHALGRIVPVNNGGSEPMAMLEIPFDVGRQLLLRAQARHWDGSAMTTFPAELKLYGDLLWQFDAPHVDPALAPYLAPPVVPDPLPPADELVQATDDLLAHGAMQGWLRRNPLLLNMVDVPEPVVRYLPRDVLVRRVLQTIASWEGHPQLLEAFGWALQAQALWFKLAGDDVNAPRAAMLAGAMAALPVDGNPLLVAILANGLDQLSTRRD
jgi:hypothetical protein